MPTQFSRDATPPEPHEIGGLFQQAGTLQQAGRPGEAEVIYRRILAGYPDHVDSLFQLGAIAHMGGNFDEALRFDRAALVLLPNAALLYFNQGLAFQAKEQSTPAALSYRRAVFLSPADVEARCNLANALNGAGQSTGAVKQYRAAVAIDPAAPRLLYNFALARTGSEQRAEALALYRRSLTLRPGYIGALCNLGNLLVVTGDAAGAAACYRCVLAIDPAIPDALYNLGNVQRDGGAPQAAMSFYRRALLLAPALVDALYNLGNLLQDQADFEDAILHYRDALTIRPNHAETLYNLGTALQASGRRAEAVTIYRSALETQPQHPELFFANLGLAFNDAGLPDEAMTSTTLALQALQENPDTLNNLGITFYDLGRFTDAILSYKRALIVKPDHEYAFSNIGNALKALGAVEQALAAFRRSRQCDPGFATAHSNELYTGLYHPKVTLTKVLDAAREWSRHHATAEKLARRPSGPAPRIGFLSADFRFHAVGNLVLPTIEVLAARDHKLALYHNSPIEDDMTDRFRAAASEWRSVYRLSDDRLAEMIERQEIDILVDLSGHSAGNRLPMLSRRVAPIQATWVGYPATTGLEAMDYLIADRWQVPDTERDFYQEKILRLPDSYLCYRPLPTAPPISALPCEKNGFVTFGSFNENSKIGAPTVRVWARILRAVAGSRLLLKSPRFSDPAARARYVGWFVEEGIEANRLDFIGVTTPTDHMASMARADIALDSFPYTGGLTTLETFWMGVPVVTCPHEGIFSRHATGYLTTLGLTELVAGDLNEYVSIAAALAADRPRLTSLRATLRQRVSDSPLCDIDRFANHFETLLDYIWRRRLAGENPSSHDIGLP